MLRITPGESFARPLSHEDEQKYLALWAEGDIEARNKLVEHNMRLVSHIMKKYFTQTDDVDDLISIGTIGLIKGINTYRPDRGVRLATYASRCIENEVLMHFRSQRKSMGDLSLSEALDVDSDGDGLSILDVLASDEDMAEQIGNNEAVPQPWKVHRRMPDRARGEDNPAPIRAERRTIDAAAGRCEVLRHKPVVRVAHREKRRWRSCGRFLARTRARRDVKIDKYRRIQYYIKGVYALTLAPAASVFC